MSVASPSPLSPSRRQPPVPKPYGGVDVRIDNMLGPHSPTKLPLVKIPKPVMPVEPFGIAPDEVKALLIDPIVIDDPNPKRNGSLALLTAARVGALDIVKYLVKQEKLPVDRVVQLGLPNETLDTPLISAAKYGHAEVVDFLLARGGAAVNARNKQGETALLAIAANPMRLPIIRQLLADNADTEVQDGEGLTALMRATKAGLVDTINVLLESGCVAGVKDYGNAVMSPPKPAALTDMPSPLLSSPTAASRRQFFGGVRTPSGNRSPTTPSPGGGSFFQPMTPKTPQLGPAATPKSPKRGEALASPVVDPPPTPTIRAKQASDFVVFRAGAYLGSEASSKALYRHIMSHNGPGGETRQRLRRLAREAAYHRLLAKRALDLRAEIDEEVERVRRTIAEAEYAHFVGSHQVEWAEPVLAEQTQIRDELRARLLSTVAETERMEKEIHEHCVPERDRLVEELRERTRQERLQWEAVKPKCCGVF